MKISFIYEKLLQTNDGENMKKAILMVTFMAIQTITSASDFSMFNDLGCLPQIHCQSNELTDYDKQFIGQLENVLSEDELKDHCEKEVFSRYRNDHEYMAQRLDEIENDYFPGFSCLQGKSSQISEHYKN